MRRHALFYLAALLTLPLSPRLRAESFHIESLELQHIEQSWGEPRSGRSVENHPLFLDGKRYARGLGTHANSLFRIELGGAAERITGTVGVDDAVDDRGSVVFVIIGDDRKLWTSGVCKGGQPARVFDVSLDAVQSLKLVVEDAGDGIDLDHADWADTVIVMKSGKPRAYAPPPEPAIVLTPKPPRSPRINGPKVYGARPGSPFLYSVPVSGERPVKYSAADLPEGLSIQEATGLITGKIAERGVYLVNLRAGNRHGTAERPFKIVCGDKICLTPPMGWNSWNCFGCDVTGANVRAAADAMVTSGLSQHGWTYINIDDCWQGSRDQGKIRPNPKFGDMRGLADYVHSKGLKVGIYSSPGPRTCASHEGSHGYEVADAQQYADWGFDYLKYDWCSYGMLHPNPDLDRMQAPYRLMREALNRTGRDIVYSLCQYGMREVWKWGADVGGNCWRVSGDITDTWSSVSAIGFAQAGREKFAGPGHWNDPDMLVIGQVGWSARVRPTRLTPNEQYTHVSLWCLLSAPLLIGCDLTQLDDFTLGLLTNDEVLEVNQDELGRQASCIKQDCLQEVWAKPMADGSVVAGLFNRGDVVSEISVSFEELGLSGECRARDLWRQQNLGSHHKTFAAAVPRHGVVLVKFTHGSNRRPRNSE